ncbi:MAG: excinuclease ABC subunit A, partial [Muribaculaceae bacterium]|nr:excinuclease ABC subunit A [Muribaculaceae bacterium]
MNENSIIVKGARVNNLKNVDVELPRNKFIVVTGLSGSGKSSLAFDTLYAEGQRRYVDSLSSYARQFVGRMSKPEVDFIKGLPPAIAIEQKVTTRNPRSTVGTSTEIYDYLRLLYGRVGRTISPVSGCEVRKHTVNDVVAMAESYPLGTRLAVLAPISLPEGRSIETQLDIFVKEGYSRLFVNDDFIEIEDYGTLDKKPGAGDMYLVIDRLMVSDDPDEQSRLADSAETAFFEGRDSLRLILWDEDGAVHHHDFSKRFEADGITFMEPNEQMVNFNNPYGA